MSQDNLVNKLTAYVPDKCVYLPTGTGINLFAPNPQSSSWVYSDIKSVAG
jgi:hypothetical protein